MRSQNQRLQATDFVSPETVAAQLCRAIIGYDREKCQALESWAREVDRLVTGRKADNIVKFR